VETGEVGREEGICRAKIGTGFFMTLVKERRNLWSKKPHSNDFPCILSKFLNLVIYGAERKSH
jgi:hypothetical protein